MFKKLNYKVLIILLAVLLAIYLISEYSGNQERTFKSEVVSIDTAKVTRIEISNPGVGDLTLKRTGPGWEMEASGKTYPVQASMLRGILAPLAGMKSEGVAAISKDKHAELKVNDTTGVHVVALNGNEKLADLYFGKLSYQQPSEAAAAQAQNMQQYQQRGRMITYVRNADDETVYGVEGFLRSTFGRKADDYRDKTLVKLNKDDITELDFQYADQGSFNLKKMDNAWYLNNQKADSTKMVRFLAKLGNDRAREFADDFNTTGKQPGAILQIKGNNFSPVVVTAYPADSTREYVITSTMNPDAKFAGAKGVYSHLFEQKDYFQK